VAKQAFVYDGSGWVDVASSVTDLTTLLPSGVINPFAGLTVPFGWLLCNGSSISRAVYPNLFSAVTASKGTVTISIATPGVVTVSFNTTTDNFFTGTPVYLTTTGALPTGLSANTTYYAILVSSSTIRLATSLANAIAGTAINTSGTQSGIHTLVHAPYGVASSTTFNLPNMQGKIPVGYNIGDAEFDLIGETGGAKTHTLTTAQIPGHTHPNTAAFTGTAGTTGNDSPDHGHAYGRRTTASGAITTGTGIPPHNGNPAGAADDAGPTAGANARHAHSFTPSGTVAMTNAANTGGDGAHNNLQPYIALNYIIKF
jgi:microcystin-dependent protein